MTDLPDLEARLRAITDLDSTLLVEAAAGTGKTALLAGRVAFALARRVAPEHIAAITFSEYAASQLAARINKYVVALLKGDTPDCLKAVFPMGLTAEELASLDAGHARIDELTVTTIHGFCQRMIHSYAVEANIDPGARMMDGPTSDAAFRMIFRQWLRDRLTRPRGPIDPIAVMSEDDPLHVEERLGDLAEFRRRHRTARPVKANLARRLDTEFGAAVRQFREWVSEQPAEGPTLRIADELRQLDEFYADCLAKLPDFRRLWTLADAPLIGGRDTETLRLVPPRWGWTWQKSIKKEDKVRLNAGADMLFGAVDAAYRTLIGEIATALVEVLSSELDEMLERYAGFKRQAAVLDFDDLLDRARALVKGHETVREALGDRYRHILVDEFQDTDPIQAETLFRIAATRAPDRWQQCVLRPGGLFMVGDPKQAIYRFRGADIRCYEEARKAVQASSPNNILRITANFRSVRGIIDYVNSHFEAPLNADGQPGYVALHAMRDVAEHGLPCVTTCTLDNRVKGVAGIRDSEAAEVAALCERLIGNIQYRDENGELVALRASDIALLAPSARDLWRYERALGKRRLPFASSAGKGLLHRQEVQDLIALARAIADASDTLAFGAVMRGPLVGLTEEELLDITASLATRPEEPDQLPRLTINTDPAEIEHPVAREALNILRDLRPRAWATTPSLLLGEAVERLAIRPILSAREGGDRARAAANVERFLELAREYEVLGLKRFVHDVANEFSLGVHQRTEGRVDAEGAIEIVTMHSAKGLEWPVVILINNGSGFHPPSEFVHRPEDDTLHWVLGGVEPPELARAIAAENRVFASERQRVIYVACTRARELLIVPEIPAMPHKTWSGVIENSLTDVPDLSLSHFVVQSLPHKATPENPQTAEIFEREEKLVRDATLPLLWLRPSDQDADRAEESETLVVDEMDAPIVPAPVGAGRLRGLVLHKLMEEVLTGELDEDFGALARRGEELMRQAATTGKVAPDAQELADTVLRTLAIPDIASLKTKLVPEFPLYGLHTSEQLLVPLVGRADAVLVEDGRPSIVLDWKSDIAPEPGDIQDHAAQLRDYLQVTGASRGALVYMTSARVHWIEATATRLQGESTTP